MPESSAKLETCPKCHKLKADSRPGTFTGWIFRANECKCAPTTTSHVKAWADPNLLFVETEVPEAQEAWAGLVQLPHPYKVLAFIGQGGMGSVYKVQDSSANKTLAIKVLRPELAADPAAVKRFELEAQAASRLEHRNLVTVYGIGTMLDGAPFLLMDYIEGESLATVVKREGRILLDRAFDIFIQICEALDHAHAKGIIHRDLKPSNIILSNEGGRERVHLVDFGIAKVQQSEVRQTMDLTSTGDVLGSPVYMSPEQCLSVHLDARSDIYSFGCLMYEVVTSKPPFQGDNPVQIIARHLTEKPVSIAAHPLIKVPPDLVTIIATCLEKNPLDRYQSFMALKEDLKCVRSGMRLSATARFKKPSGTTRRTVSALAMLGLIAISVSFAIVMLPSNMVSLWGGMMGGKAPGSGLEKEAAYRIMDKMSAGFVLESRRSPSAIRLFLEALDQAEAQDAPSLTKCEIAAELANCYLVLGRHDEIEPLYKRVQSALLEIDKKLQTTQNRTGTVSVVRLHYLAATAAIKSNNWTEAENRLNRAIQIASLSGSGEAVSIPRFHMDLAKVYMYTGRPKQAEEILQRVRRECLGNPARDNKMLKTVYMYLSKAEAGMKSYHEAVGYARVEQEIRKQLGEDTKDVDKRVALLAEKEEIEKRNRKKQD